MDRAEQGKKTQEKNNDTESVNKLKRAFAYNLFYKQGKTTHSATLNDYYLSVAQTSGDYI